MHGLVSSGTGRRWLIALFLVLVFPAIAFGIGTGVQTKYQNDLYDVVQQDLGRQLSDAEKARLDVATVCALPEAAGEDPCQDLNIANLTRDGAIGAGVVGLLLLGFVAFCSAFARRDRAALLRLFRPGVYVTLGGVALLVAADGALAVSSVYLGLGVFAGRIYPMLIFGIAIGVLLGVVGIIRAMVGATRRAVNHAIARHLDAGQAPAVHGLVAELAASLGTLPPDHVLVGLDPEFYVTEADIAATDGQYRGRSLYLSLPLLRILSPAELRAGLGHELGHFRGADTEFSQRFYPVYRGTGEAIARLNAAASGSWIRGMALYPAFLLLVLFYEGFAVAERAVSRDRELAADGVGVQAASNRDLGTALVKLYAFTQQWEAAGNELRSAALSGTRLTNAGDRFVELVRAAAVPAALEGLDQQRLPHPTDSHPPLSQRLEALALTQAELATAALDVAPVPAADAVAPNRAQLEEELTAWIESRIRAAAQARGLVARAS